MSRFTHDIKAIFNNTILNSRDGDLVLEDMNTEFTVYTSSDDVIDGLSRNVYKGRKVAILKAINDQVAEGLEVEDAFLKFGIITEDEYLIFSRSNSLKEAIKMVLEFRKEGSVFPKVATKIIAPIIASILLSLIVLRLLGNFLVVFFKEELLPIMKVKSGFAPKVDFPYLMENTMAANLAIVGTILLIISIFMTYKHIYNNNPQIIYKIFPMKFYDDFLKYFSIADKMHQVSAVSDEIFEYLASHVKPVGLRAMFKEMYENGSEYSLSLEKFNAPARLVSIIRRKEDNSTLWDDMEGHILNYARKTRDSRAEFVQKYIAGMIVYLSFIIFLMTMGSIFASFGLTVWAIL